MSCTTNTAVVSTSPNSSCNIMWCSSIGYGPWCVIFAAQNAGQNRSQLTIVYPHNENIGNVVDISNHPSIGIENFCQIWGQWSHD